MTVSSVTAPQGTLNNPPLRSNDPLSIFERLRASVSGADRLERQASLNTAPATGTGQSSHLPSRNVPTPVVARKQFKDARAMDVDQTSAATKPTTSSGLSRTLSRVNLSGGRPSSIPTPSTAKAGSSKLTRRHSIETGLESRLASLTIRKIKPIPTRGPSTPKKQRTGGGALPIPPPDAPKKARSPDHLKDAKDESMLPALQRKPVLKRRPTEPEAGPAAKRARIVRDASVVMGSSSDSFKKPQGRGAPPSPSRHAAATAARRRKSVAGVGGSKRSTANVPSDGMMLD
ncbi:hypothetical protein BXZ70DRAFT_1077407 [Cristinia sonorae]|uniref:Uncharacterized protein n=1 Tax=Cristinia sonorae TaxID=1940300 RepID=A0A8K0UNQ6_9AGAR|nr:hypothetical protein BXZ70DRAFT_1077407 [Cristinia sonorae]